MALRIEIQGSDIVFLRCEDRPEDSNHEEEFIIKDSSVTFGGREPAPSVRKQLEGATA